MPKKKSVPLPSESEIRDQSIAAIRKTAEPVTAKQVCGLLAGSFKISDLVLAPILDGCVAINLLHSIPPATAKGKSRYWDRGLIEFGQLQIEQLIQKKGSQPLAKLKTATKGLSEVQFRQAFKNLIEANRLREHPPVGKSKTVKYGTTAPAVEPYLNDVGKQLVKIVEQLLGAGVDPQSLAEALVIRLTQAGLAVSTNHAAPGNSDSSTNRELELLMLMKQIEPGAERGALVTARELRRAANFDKHHFDETILGLARQGQLMLHRHDYASGLSSSERDELVTDGSGTYYVGMALRQVDG